MAYLKFNKAELVNLEYSLKRELIASNRTGAYFNTTIVCCNTRKYHGLLVVPVDEFGGDKYVLLSSLDETLIQHGKEFNLGIHDYGGVFEPRGHKYIIDFERYPIPTITYRVGGIILKKSFIFARKADRLLIKYTLVDAHSDTTIRFKPFLAFRSTHSLTKANPQASTRFVPVENGCSYRMYEDFPDLNLQFSKAVDYVASPDWYYNIEYSEEARRGFDCHEDLFVPGFFELPIKKGESIIVSASTRPVEPSTLKRSFDAELKLRDHPWEFMDAIGSNAHRFIVERNGTVLMSSGLSWLQTGILRDTLLALPGLTLFNDADARTFEKCLDCTIEKNNNQLLISSMQVDAPLRLAYTLQQYVDFGTPAAKVWKKYGKTVKSIVESYLNGRPEARVLDNGMIWAEYDGKPLSWMNAWCDGKPVTERSGMQVETNLHWYNTLRFVLEMEGGKARGGELVERCRKTAAAIEENFLKVFWFTPYDHLADYVDASGQCGFTRPNQLYACSLPYSPVPEEYQARILRAVRSELLTARGIRTLSPKNPLYKGVYEGNQHERDLAYHNGTARVWLLGPYICGNFKLYGASFVNRAKEILRAFEDDMSVHGVGCIAELYDGNPPHYPHGAISSATGTSSLLTAYHLIEKYSEEKL